MGNKVYLIGRAGKEPELKSGNNGEFCLLSLATTESYKDKSGEKVEKTEWHNLQFFGKLALIVHKYVKKGQLLHVVGKISSNKKDDKTYYNIICNEMEMIGPRVEGAENNASSSKENVDDLPF